MESLLSIYPSLMIKESLGETGQQALSFDTDSFKIGIDNRCSACISNRRELFPFTDLRPSNRCILGYGGERSNKIMVGTMRVTIEDNGGKPTTFLIKNSYYDPEGSVTLLSPQHMCQNISRDLLPTTGPIEETYSDRIKLRWKDSERDIKLDPELNVASIYSAPAFDRYSLFCQEAMIHPETEDRNPITISTTLEDTTNNCEEPSRVEDEPTYEIPRPTSTSFDIEGALANAIEEQTPLDNEEESTLSASAEFLALHQRLNHASPARIIALAKLGVVPTRLATCSIPVCSACLYGKASRRQWRHKASPKVVSLFHPKMPGEVVSVDQLVSRTPGLIAQMSGFLTKERYFHATVFCDNFSDFTYVHIQKHASAEETLSAKVAFERHCGERGVKVIRYHADNGIFATSLWRQSCESQNQRLSFAAVGGHHQNGKAENRIRQLQDQTRTSLIHAQRRWPAAITANLWPYALRLSCESGNELPKIGNKDGKTPAQLFSGSNVLMNPKHWQPFGCPTYVLLPNLQSAGGIHGKWEARSRVGVYLGRSPQHARSVALVLSIETGHVSPQFHVRFDPTFRTVSTTHGDPTVNSQWQYKCGFSRDQSQNSQFHRIGTDVSVDSERTAATTTDWAVLPSKELRREEIEPSNIKIEPVEPEESPFTEDSAAEIPEETPVVDQHQNNTSPEQLQPTSNVDPQPRRSTRTRKPVQRLIEAITATSTASDDYMELLATTKDARLNIEEKFDKHPLLAFAASADPDTLHYHEAMRAPDRQEFIKAMEDEIRGQMSNQVFEIIPSEQVPEGASILPAVWAMRRKRQQSTGKVYKWKSRLNIGGHRMVEHRDFDPFTYSPTASWPSIRLLLSMVLLHGWHTYQVDYVQAYPQAPADRDLYMKVPEGCHIDGVHGKYILKVKKNIYGGKAAGRIWYLYLKGKLESVGFTISKHDDCVFFKGMTMYILYTDDSILAGPDDKELQRILQLIQSTGLNITTDSGIDDFLGVTIERSDNGTIQLTQRRLIKSILQDLGLDKENVTTKSTPAASSKLLSHHLKSPPHDGSFNYRRVVGKLLYLEKATRPDIAYAVHQCARFSAEPKVEHTKAIRWIGRYLKGTMDMGICMSPTNNRSLDLFVDSDFAGNWDIETAPFDPATSRSRHGYILMYCGMPVIWCSQLQSLTCLSTTEAEYIALSKSVQDLLPMIWLLQEMKQHGFTVHTTQAKVHCKIFEDNSGAIEIATKPKFRPRTKHINQRFHFFRDYIGHILSVHKIETEDQPADFLTKALEVRTFTKHRKFVMGW